MAGRRPAYPPAKMKSIGRGLAGVPGIGTPRAAPGIAGTCARPGHKGTFSLPQSKAGAFDALPGMQPCFPYVFRAEANPFARGLNQTVDRARWDGRFHAQRWRYPGNHFLDRGEVATAVRGLRRWDGNEHEAAACNRICHGGSLLLVLSRSGSNSAVECQLPKLDVAGSIPVSRSNPFSNLGNPLFRPAPKLLHLHYPRHVSRVAGLFQS